MGPRSSLPWLAVLAHPGPHPLVRAVCLHIRPPLGFQWNYSADFIPWTKITRFGLLKRRKFHIDGMCRRPGERLRHASGVQNGTLYFSVLGWRRKSASGACMRGGGRAVPLPCCAREQGRVKKRRVPQRAARAGKTGVKMRGGRPLSLRTPSPFLTPRRRGRMRKAVRPCGWQNVLFC